MSTAIDLTALPPLELVEQLTLDEATNQALYWLSGNGLEIDGGAENPAYRVVRSLAYRDTQFRAALKRMVDNFTLATATGTALDHIGVTYHRTLRLNGEADEAYRQRIASAPEGLSVAGPRNAYIVRAKAAHPDVLDAAFHSPSPNVVTIPVLLRQGVDTDTVLSVVTGALSADDTRPQGDRVTVSEVGLLRYNIEAEVELSAGVHQQYYIDQAAPSLERYCQSQYKMGGKVTDSGVKAALHQFGAVNVNLVNFNDVVASAFEAPSHDNLIIRVV